jgi:N-acetyl-gamma-glutamyl-phosphate reductase
VKNVAHTNYCDIGVHYDKEKQRILVLAAIDNLMKGAAGQAVQNMNIMQGFDEKEGLKLVPPHP